MSRANTAAIRTVAEFERQCDINPNLQIWWAGFTIGYLVMEIATGCTVAGDRRIVPGKPQKVSPICS